MGGGWTQYNTHYSNFWYANFCVFCLPIPKLFSQSRRNIHSAGRERERKGVWSSTGRQSFANGFLHVFFLRDWWPWFFRVVSHLRTFLLCGFTHFIYITIFLAGEEYCGVCSFFKTYQPWSNVKCFLQLFRSSSCLLKTNLHDGCVCIYIPLNFFTFKQNSLGCTPQSFHVFSHGFSTDPPVTSSVFFFHRCHHLGIYLHLEVHRSLGWLNHGMVLSNGSEIWLCNQLRLAGYPIIYKVLAPSQVLVSRISEPSTVWLRWGEGYIFFVVICWSLWFLLGCFVGMNYLDKL